MPSLVPMSVAFAGPRMLAVLLLVEVWICILNPFVSGRTMAQQSVLNLWCASGRNCTGWWKTWWSWYPLVVWHPWWSWAYFSLVWFLRASGWSQSKRLPCFWKHISPGWFWGDFCAIWRGLCWGWWGISRGSVCGSVCTRRSLMYTKMLLMSRSTPSMNLWKLVGHLRRPMGDVIQWNWPFLGIVKTVSFWDSSSSCIWYKPDMRSKVLKMLEFAQPMSLMHSLISFMEYLSMCEFGFNSQKSWMIQSPWPCFFGMQKMGELYSVLNLLTTPNFNHSSRVCLMNWWCASGIFNCFC